MRTPVHAPIRKGVLAGKNVIEASPDGCANGTSFCKASHKMVMQRMSPIEAMEPSCLIEGEWMLIPAPNIEKKIHGKTGYVPVRTK